MFNWFSKQAARTNPMYNGVLLYCPSLVHKRSVDGDSFPRISSIRRNLFGQFLVASLSLCALVCVCSVFRSICVVCQRLFLWCINQHAAVVEIEKLISIEVKHTERIQFVSIRFGYFRLCLAIQTLKTKMVGRLQWSFCFSSNLWF